MELSQTDLATLQQLEQRRAENDRAMWLAPMLTMTAQAFLLQVLSGDVPRLARGAVLAAGLAATFAALWTVLRGRSREVLYSETIAARLDELGMPDVRPEALRLSPQRKPGWRKLDRILVSFAGRDIWPMPYICWAVALFLFAVADIAVFLAA